MRGIGPVVVLLGVLFLVPAEAQERQKKPGGEDFNQIVDAAKADFAKKEYGSSLKKLQEAITVASRLLREAVYAAMPEAPANFTKREPNKSNGMEMVFGGNFQSIEQRYVGTDNRSNSASIQVHPRSPMVQTIEIAFKMAAMQPDLEIVKYKEDKALFKKEGNGRLVLQLIIGGLHYVEIRATGLDEDSFFKWASQAMVDKLKAVLGG